MDDAAHRAGTELAASGEKDRAKRAVIWTAPAGDQHGHTFATQRIARWINQVTRRKRQRVDILDAIAMFRYDQLASGFITDPTHAADGRIPLVSQGTHQLWQRALAFAEHDEVNVRIG